MFGKFIDKNKRGKDLSLGDYRSIWTKFCFLDESGSLNNLKDPFFTVGFIKCSQPYYIQSKILYERQRNNFYDEMHFNKLSRRNIDFAKLSIDSFLSTGSLSFYSYTLDKQGEYFNKEFGNNPWQAYEDISIRVLESAISDNEILIILADHITSPKNVRFEVNVKRKINDKLKRLAIAGVCRFDSRSNDLLQVADLMVGAITYDLKRTTNIVSKGDKHKIDFIKHFKRVIGLDDNSFIDGFRSHNFNIFVDQDVKQRLPLKDGTQIK